VVLVADKLITDAVATYDLIACPGGMPGAERLRDSKPLEALMRQQRDAGRLNAAICATPVVFLQPAGLLEGRAATAHPAFSDKLPDQGPVSRRVVVDGTLTTSRGPGTAFEFALELVKQLYGEDKAREVGGGGRLGPQEWRAQWPGLCSLPVLAWPSRYLAVAGLRCKNAASLPAPPPRLLVPW
jgi:4-methyl-5(b-hydroxyethyl)-thiazole monophosphate biosynthesis